MPGQRSRTYKLQLSVEGMQLFLRCHCRLCRVVGDFLPYGTTLLIAASAFCRVDAEAAASRLLEPAQARFGGKIIRFVGTSPNLAVIVKEIGRKLTTNYAVHPAPQVWKIFNVSLAHMDEMTDREIVREFKLFLSRADVRQSAFEK